MTDWGDVTPNLLDVLVFDRVAERLKQFDAKTWGATYRRVDDDGVAEEAPQCLRCHARYKAPEEWVTKLSNTLHRRSTPTRCINCHAWVRFTLEGPEKDYVVQWARRQVDQKSNPGEQGWLIIDAALSLYLYSRNHLRLAPRPDYDQFVNDVLDLDLRAP